MPGFQLFYGVQLLIFVNILKGFYYRRVTFSAKGLRLYKYRTTFQYVYINVLKVTLVPKGQFSVRTTHHKKLDLIANN